MAWASRRRFVASCASFVGENLTRRHEDTKTRSSPADLPERSAGGGGRTSGGMGISIARNGFELCLPVQIGLGLSIRSCNPDIRYWTPKREAAPLKTGRFWPKVATTMAPRLDCTLRNGAGCASLGPLRLSETASDRSAIPACISGNSGQHHSLTEDDLLGICGWVPEWSIGLAWKACVL